MKLNQQNKIDIERHALEEFPNECCGLLVNDRIIKCNNIAKDKDKFFEIDPKDYLRATKEGLIKAYYHSHTEDNEEFSAIDKAISLSHQIPLIMFFVKNKEFKIYG